MVFKDFQAYLCLIVVCMTILEDLLVENVWNLSIFIKALLKSHSCFKNWFHPKKSPFSHYLQGIILYTVCLHDLIFWSFLARFDLATRDSYLTTLVEVFMSHILSGSSHYTNLIERAEHTILVLKPANKYRVEILFWC